MDITKKLLELDPTLQRHNEGYWDRPFEEGQFSFSSFNDAGIEVETGEFLYGLVRLLKPKRVLETGTHWGIGASYMGMALKDNHRGTLDTVEFLVEIYDIAQKRIKDLDLEGFVKLHLGNVKNFTPEGQEQGTPQTYQLILLDTEPQTRFAEFEQFYNSLDAGGFIFIHDLHRHMHQIPNEEHGFAWPYGKLTDFMKEKVKNGEVRPFHFSTPRGLTGFYKVHPDDYVWT